MVAQFFKQRQIIFFMKISILLVMAAVPFVSCKKEITQVQQVDQAFSATYTLNPSGWTTSNGGSSFATTLNVPELDDKILNDGGVIVYLSFDNGASFEALPEVFNGIAYGSVHELGIITIDLQAADGSGDVISAPGTTILAKVILIDATAL